MIISFVFYSTFLNLLFGQIKSTEITFQQGDVKLSGTFFLPSSGEALYPAVIITHGSGPTSRRHNQFLVPHFLKNEIAVLMYDKRGVGKSTGDWQTATIDDLAGDALAALAFLQSTKKIHVHKIGMCGVSQAASVMARAAATSEEVAFIIPLVGGTGFIKENADPKESQNVTRVEDTLRRRGYSEGVIKEAVDFAIFREEWVNEWMEEAECAANWSGCEDYMKRLNAVRFKEWFLIVYGKPSHTYAYADLIARKRIEEQFKKQKKQGRLPKLGRAQDSPNVKRVESSIKSLGYPHSVVKQAVEFAVFREEWFARWMREAECAADWEGCEEYIEKFKEARREKWFSDAYPVTSYTYAYADIFEREKLEKKFKKLKIEKNLPNRDLEYLRYKLKCPVLAIFGGKDSVVRTSVVKSDWEDVLEKSKNQDYVIKIYPEGGHEIPKGAPQLMVNWVLERFGEKPPDVEKGEFKTRGD